MLEAVMNSLPDCDALVMAAAVGDFSPADYSQDKIKKGLSTTEIRLKNTPDILAEVANYKDRYRRPLVTIGFAAESQDLLANARGKLTAKKLDMIVANDITSEGSGFKGETNDVLLVYPDGSSQDLPLMSKTEVSETVMQNIAEILGNQAD
jgi:phosphopantothenoylcysteine decarboxylase/phosphopantothenate--cysteine ligase